MTPADSREPSQRLAELPTWLLAQANARAHRLLGEALGRHDMRGYHYRLLAGLQESGPASQMDLGRRTGIDRSDVVAVVNDLVARGLVTRAPDERDRRRNVITIGSAGLEFLRELDEAVAAVQDAVLQPLAPAERIELVRLLALLAQPPR